jgi:hypothetical protein
MKVLTVLTSRDQPATRIARPASGWRNSRPPIMFSRMLGQITPASPKGGRPLLDTKSNEPNFQTDITRRFEKDAHANGDRPVNIDS